VPACAHRHTSSSSPFVDVNLEHASSLTSAHISEHHFHQKIEEKYFGGIKKGSILTLKRSSLSHQTSGITTAGDFARRVDIDNLLDRGNA